MMIKLKPRTILSQNYSFMITLPHVWLEHHQLNKQSKVLLSMGVEGELIISPIK
ncbi:hypothetical protein HYY69_03270 [Candidatus Woesearchaeota archaeon]|nr:hypothetical protein [Candidatus Woesearchaeota archaeon]